MARRVTGWRKLAAAMWGPPNDPQFYGEMEVDAADLLRYLDEVRRATGAHVTVTHLVGRAVAHGLTAVPRLQVRLGHGREHDRTSLDVFFIVAAPDEELSGVKVGSVDKLAVWDVAAEVERRCSAIRTGTDEEFGRTKTMLERVPGWLLGPAIRLSAFVTTDLDIDLPKLGLPREPFGSAMVTSVGMWGISRAFSPLARHYRVPVLVLVGAVQEKAVVVAGRVVARPMLTLTATFDHRYADGSQAAQFAAAVREYLVNPVMFEPALPAWEPGLSAVAT
ncbi:MAG TPA: 2-oxo acid dehydrogenase subunit E2 [Mycobacteriales bacterium]|nr:2-oxo acid dehydrogenase subunit E2 [Mycobacteriales bacterium]